MRVCHFLSGLDPAIGGPAMAIAGLAPAQARAGLDVSVAAAWVDRPGEETAARMRQVGVDVRLLGPCTGPTSRHPDLPRFVDELVAAADVVHVHALFEEIQHLASRSAARRGIPYVVRTCGMLSPWSLARGRWKKRLYMLMRLRRNLNGAAALHFTATREGDLTRRLHLTPPAIVEPNGVDLGEFEHLPPSGTFRSRHPQLAKRQVVMFLGRIHLQKGLDLLIRAFAQAAMADAALVLVGPDQDGHGAGLRKTAAELGVADRVLFVGPLYGRDRVEALSDADLFALTSYHENFGIAAIESLAAGVPVMVSDEVNIHAGITAAGVGIAVPLDAHRIAAELRRWLSDERLRREAAARARPFVRATYDWNQIARRWAGHYDRLRAAPSA
jgi:glycosyltransferase involved in cell wall biosynthesis